MPATRRPAARRAPLAARAGLLVLAGGSALGLTACNPSLVGAAAVVGEDRLTVGQLQERVTDYTGTLPDPSFITNDATAVQTAFVERYVRHQLLRELAARHGVRVSGGEIDAFLADFAEQQGGDLTGFLAQNGFTEESVREAVHDELVRQELVLELGGPEQVEQALAEAAAELEVEVNPRYGQWEGNRLATESGSVSEPSAEAGEDRLAPAPGGPAPE